MVVALRAADQAAQPGDTSALEYKVKAGYLFNFAKVVEWPAASLPAPDSPFVIGVLDRGEALPVVRTLLEGRDVNGHPVRIKAVAAGNVGSDFHILFVTRTAGEVPEKIHASLGGSATLLVGETEGFAQHGGILNFVMVEDSVKFEANPVAAGRSHLGLGSQLLKLAIIVKDGSPAERP